MNEAAGTVTLYVNRTGDLSQAATVQIDTADVTAKAGTDYTAFSQQLTFAPGQGQASFTVDITNKHVLGNPEQFNVKLSIPSGADPLLADVSSTNGLAAVTISETAASHFSVGDTFGNPTVGVSEAAGTVRVFVNRSGNLAGTATVDIQSVDGTAMAGTDYTALTHQTLTFADGQAQQFVDIPITDLHKISGTEQFNVKLSATPPNSDPLNADISQDTATVTISDNDPVQSHFTVGDANGNGTLAVNEAAGTVRIFVNRSGSLAGTAKVDLKTVDGTGPAGTAALAGTDYTALATQTLVFGPGVAQQFVDIPILDPHKVGGSVQFTAQLALTPGQADDSADITANHSAATVTINDNDPVASHFSIGDADGKTALSVNESAGTVTIVVKRSGSLAGPASIDIQTDDGTAKAGTTDPADYVGLSRQTLTFADQQDQMSITIPIRDVHKTSGTSQFAVELLVPNGADATLADLVPNANKATVTINDNDPAPSHFALLGDGKTANQVTAVTVDEQAGTATFTVVRTGDTTGAASVNYATVDGTAKSTGTPADFQAATGTVSFLANETQKTITIPINNPGKTSGSTQFTVTLSAPLNGDLTVGRDSGTVTIIDEDPVINQFSIFGDGTSTIAAVDEGAGTITFVVKRAGDATGTASVDYTTVDDTAQAGTAYTKMSGTLQFASGEVEKMITVPILHSLDAGSDQFNIQLSNPTNGDIAANNATGIAVINNFPLSVFSIASTDVNDTDGKATITVTRSGNLSGAASVKYQTADNTAIAGTDYTAIPLTELDFASGEGSKTFTVDLINTHKVNASAQFNVKLSTVAADVTNGTVSAQAATGVVTIHDLGPSHFSIGSVVANDNDGMATLTITRSGDPTGPATVKYRTVDGTAVAGTAYTGVPLTEVDFADGEMSKTITVPLISTHNLARNDQFTVALSQSTNADITAGMDVGTVTIHELGASHFAINSSTVNNNDGTARLTVTRSGDLTGPAAVKFQTLNGTATAGTDFTSVPITELDFADGESSKTITVNLLNGHRALGTGQFTVQLSTPVNADITSGGGKGIVTINDLGPSIFTISNATAHEADGTVTLTVSRTGDTSGPAAVTYQTADGTALQGIDYTAIAATELDFGPNEAQKTITIPLRDAQSSGADINFTVKLSSPQNAVIATNQSNNPLDTGTITVKEDDVLGSHFSIQGPAAVNETAGTVTFTVHRTGNLSKSASVSLSTADGVAVAGTDYVSTAQTLNFAGTSGTDQTQTFTVPLINFNHHADSQFSVNLTSAHFADISGTQGSAQVTIHDDADLSATIADVSVTKPTSGVSQATFTLKLSNPDNTEDLTFKLQTVDGTGANGATSAGPNADFRADSFILVTIPKGQTSATFTVDIRGNDVINAGPETFTVQSTSVPAAITGPIQTTGTITENVAEVVTVAPASASEGGNEVFQVTLAHPFAKDFTFTYVTMDGTAKAGTDFTGVTLQSAVHTLTILAGQTTGTIPISTLTPPGTGGSKAFTIELSSPSSGTFAASSITGTIIENPATTLSIDDATITEGGNEVFHVTLSQAVGTDTTFTYVTHDGAATNGTAAKSGTDYAGTSTPITVTIPAGQTTATFSIPTIDPGIAGPPKTFTVELASPSTGITLGDSSGTGTITNIHAPSVRINDVQILEGSDPANPNMAVFTVTLSHAVPDQSVVLQYFTVDGTSPNGATSVGTAKDFTGHQLHQPQLP